MYTWPIYHWIEGGGTFCDVLVGNRADDIIPISLSLMAQFKINKNVEG